MDSVVLNIEDEKQSLPDLTCDNDQQDEEEFTPNVEDEKDGKKEQPNQNKKNNKFNKKGKNSTSNTPNPSDNSFTTFKYNSKLGKDIFPTLMSNGSNNSNKGIKNSNNGNNSNNNNNKSTHSDFLKTIKDLVASKLSKNSYYFLDSWVLHLYYRCASILFYAMFLNVWSCWFIKDPIICVSGAEVEKSVASHILNICLSYPFLEDPKTQERRYILFYRWIHYSALLIGILFYLPRSLMKTFNDPKLYSLLEHLKSSEKTFDERSNLAKREIIFLYAKGHLGTHKMQALLFVLNHLFAALIAIMVTAFINFQLQGRFMYLPQRTFPFNRDPRTFSDELSSTFPPFAKCEINKAVGMYSKRVETLHCHLTVMELYEKVFFALWFFLSVIILLALFYSLCLISIIILPPIRYLILRTTYNPPESSQLKWYLIKKLDYGDYFMLFKIKHSLSDNVYFEALSDIKQILEMRSSIFKGAAGEVDNQIAYTMDEFLMEPMTSTPATKLELKTNQKVRNRK